MFSSISVHAEEVSNNNDIVDTTNHLYTFTEMQEDLALLKQRYTDEIDIKILGQSVDNRNIYQVILGNPDAKNAIYIHSTIHGRE